MKYFVIECFDTTTPNFVMDLTDETNPKVFSTDKLEDAIKEASECQNGYILDFDNLKIINSFVI